MAKIGLAAELAKQAAQAAREEVQAKEGASTGGPQKASFAGWKVPVLATDFSLDAALSTALGHAEKLLNRQLGPEGLVVNLQQGATSGTGEGVAHVQEKDTGRVLRGYDALGLLRLYAAQRNIGGAVVDGQV